MASTPTDNPIQVFFASYDGFQYNPAGQSLAQFRSLSRFMNFQGHERLEARACLTEALSGQFNEYFGTNVDSMDSWRKFFQVLEINIEDIPDTVKDCQKKVASIHVNIVELVDWTLSPDVRPRPRKFETEEALAVYSKKKKKIFPKEGAYGSFLKFLLRGIYMYSGGGKGRRGRRRRRGGPTVT